MSWLLWAVFSGLAFANCPETAYNKLAAAVAAGDTAAIRAGGECIKDVKHPSLLKLAAEKSGLETFSLLLQLGADPNLRNIHDDFCSYQILQVVQGLRTDAFPFVKALVEAGADLHSCAEDKPGHCGDAVCDTSKFPLGQAAERGDVDTVNLLADHHARIEGDELFYSAPDAAPITARLLELGADPKIAQNAPLFRTHSADAVKLLVQAGADINFRQFGYGQAIPLAIYSQPEVFLMDPVIAAIDVGADLRIPMTVSASWPCAGLSATLCWASMMTPTSLMALHYSLKVSPKLDTEQTDAEGRTVAMLLSRYYFFRTGRNVKTEVLKALIARGANLKAADKNGKSVLRYWEEYARENRVEIPLIKAALGI